jgi:hypothetical protein
MLLKFSWLKVRVSKAFYEVAQKRTCREDSGLLGCDATLFVGWFLKSMKNVFMDLVTLDDETTFLPNTGTQICSVASQKTQIFTYTSVKT